MSGLSLGLGLGLSQRMGVGVAGQTVILLAIGQSNMVGYDTAANIDPTLDAPISGVVQYLDPRDTEILPATVASGDSTSGWTPSGCTLATVGGRLVATVTSGSNPRFSRTVSGLEAGATYCVELGDAIGPAGASMTARIDSPQTQRFVLNTANRTERFYFTPSSTSATLYMISATTQPTAGTTFGASSFSVRKVLAPGAGWSESPQRDAMDWPDALPGSGTPVQALSAPGTSPASHAARELMARGAAKVIIIPCAVGSTKLVASPAEWGLSGTRYLDALAKLTAVVATYPNALVRGLWAQGESDNGTSQSNYQSALTSLILGLRAVAPNMRFIIGSIVPEYVAANPPMATIQAAQQAVVASVGNAAFVQGPTGYGRDANLHYNSAGVRILGAALGASAAIR